MCLASNDNINKRITLHECFNFERQSWHEPGNLEVKNVSPYSLSTSYRRGRWFESHLGNTFFSIRWIYIYLTWRENNIPQSQAFDSIYILPASFPLLVVPHAVIPLETNRCYLEALCLYKIDFFEWLELWKKSIQPLEWWNDATTPPGHFRNILILNNPYTVTWQDGRVVKAQCCRHDNVGSILDSTMCVCIFFFIFF